MPVDGLDYADFFESNISIHLYCSSIRTIMCFVEVQDGLYDIERGRREMGRDTS